MTERREIESLRETKKTYGIEDISHSKQTEITNQIRKLFNQYLQKYESQDITIQKITICGSFAHGDALEHISDLDVRLVLDKDIQNNDKIADYIKENYNTKEDDLFGFVDVQCHTNDSSDPEHVTIWDQ
jgi:tRNA nucleotidyltransferase (CCA-adding enzyme)